MVSRSIMYVFLIRVVLALAVSVLPIAVSAGDISDDTSHEDEVVGNYILRAGDPSLAEWKLTLGPRPDIDHANVDALVNLGRTLFFDKRLSANNTHSCASCHRPELGWSDGLPTAVGSDGKSLTRATPSLVNLAYGTIFNWDGRATTLAEQAMMPVFSPDEMGIEPEELFSRLRDDEFYRRTFAQLFPEEPIDESLVGRAIATFEKTLIVQNTRFDQWIDGGTEALTSSEVRGFGIFLDSKRANCAKCHHAPNFSDNGFHNIGLSSITNETPDLGRYNIRPVKLMRGAFKTPTLRNISLTAPYFHDGSAQTLEDVVEHYIQGGEIKDNLSPEMKEIELNIQEKHDLIAFLNALTESPGDSLKHSHSMTSD